MFVSEIYRAIHSLFTTMPELAVFVSLAIGYAIGRINFGKFQLGGVAGSLLAGVLVSQFGVEVDATVKNILFALFIFAVGYQSGPKFFRSLGKRTLREVLLAVIVAVLAGGTALTVARLMHFDKGLAAGIAAGGLTQSAIMGVAGDALTKLGLSSADLQQYTTNIGVGYAVTYIFGTLGSIIVCVYILPKFMGQGLRASALAAESASNEVIALDADQSYALNRLVGRVFRLTRDDISSVHALEALGQGQPLSVEKVKRGTALLDVGPDLALQSGDLALVVGRRETLVPVEEKIGEEVTGLPDMDLVMKTQEVVVTQKDFEHCPIGQLADKIQGQLHHGVYLMSVVRNGKDVALSDGAELEKGDVISLYGSQSDVNLAVASVGSPINPSTKTDMVALALGIIVGLLVGMLSLKIGGIPLTLGSGGGVLLAGLFFGWFKSKRPQLGGSVPSPALQLLSDLGLAGFVAVVGLNSGLQAIETVKQHGLMILLGGLIVTFVPLLVTMILGRYVLGYKNAAEFAGALSGARSSNPAFGQVQSISGNFIPTIPFAITYALSNVFLTLLGPIIVALA
jgi:aspartate-alanine antiporter